MLRSFAYACVAGVLSAGAPAALLGGRLARTRPRLSLRSAMREVAADPVGYVCVGTVTAVAFGVFGYVVGRKADRLVELSQTDPLTGLSNGRGLFDRLERELARSRRYRAPLALLLVDLDGLKSVNDRFGHRSGDEAIRRVGEVIRSELRETDVGARWGGDEFAVLAPNTSATAALALAERIRALVPEHTGAAWRVTGSIGVATLDPDTDGTPVSAATLMRIADGALYQAKRRGRNRVVSSSPATTQRTERERDARRHAGTPLIPT